MQLSLFAPVVKGLPEREDGPHLLPMSDDKPIARSAVLRGLAEACPETELTVVCSIDRDGHLFVAATKGGARTHELLTRARKAIAAGRASRI
jgi:hypothetical protein